MSTLALDAQALYVDLLAGVRALWRPEMHMAGVTSGGVWLAQRLGQDLGLSGRPGILSSALHRDDYAQRGMTAAAQTQLSFDVNGAHILILDDVLYTGRTIRAALNEIFDYGRPAQVLLGVLIERDGRQIPVQADCKGGRMALGSAERIKLTGPEPLALSIHSCKP